MRFWLKGNVTIPPRPHTVGGLIGWARGVNRALTELRDRKIEGSIAKGGGSSPPASHMWKVSQAAFTVATEEAPSVPQFKVLEGIATIQGTRVIVATVDELAAPNSEGGYISLKITRVESSRAYDEAIPAQIVFTATEPTSQYYEEYTILAEIEKITTGEVVSYEIHQCRNDEICSYEIMVVENGEFALIPIQANSRNSYSPPAP